MRQKIKQEYLSTILRQAEKIEALQDAIERLSAEITLHRARLGAATPAYQAAEQTFLSYKQELRRLHQRGESVGYEQLMALVAGVQRREQNT